MLLTFLNTLATIISVISLLIVTYGVLVCFIAFLRNEIKKQTQMCLLTSKWWSLGGSNS